MKAVDWSIALKPLLKQYKGQQHPQDYNNIYQLLVMVVLAARDSDKHINQVGQAFFKSYPGMNQLAGASVASIQLVIKGTTNYHHKAEWLSKIAQTLREDKHIPLHLEALVELPGIGRKSANVILRESGATAEGIMVDLHTVRVSTRLGITGATRPDKIEIDLMQLLPKRQWDAGMAMSFHGRAICRAKPRCEVCMLTNICGYYRQVIVKDRQ